MYITDVDILLSPSYITSYERTIQGHKIRIYQVWYHPADHNLPVTFMQKFELIYTLILFAHHTIDIFFILQTNLSELLIFNTV